MKALIIVDMQNDFIDGILGSKEAQAIVPKVVEKIKNWDGEIFMTRDTHYEDYLKSKEGLKLPIEHCIKGTYGWEINDEVQNAYLIKKKINENICINVIVDKPTFGSRAMADYFNLNRSYEEIEIVGLCTGICVLANAVILKSCLYNVTEITVDASCCACVSPESHKIALEAMKLQQINIINE